MIIKCINNWINKNQNNYDYYSFIFYFFQILGLGLLFETVELNCYNLNKNTRRNINLRINDDLLDRTDSFNDGDFETKDGYIFKILDDSLTEKDNIKIELNQIKSEQDNNNNLIL